LAGTSLAAAFGAAAFLGAALFMGLEPGLTAGAAGFFAAIDFAVTLVVAFFCVVLAAVVVLRVVAGFFAVAVRVLEVAMIDPFQEKVHRYSGAGFRM
jgi:hypothetical protein